MANGEVAKKGGWRQRLRRRWRPWLRAIHRDAGYLAVGLTIVYALSGLAINHINDWDADYSVERDEHAVKLPLPDDEQAAAARVASAAGVSDPIADIYLEEGILEVTFYVKERTLKADVATGAIVETYKEPRFLLRVSNWLHAARGKPAWNYIADTYAIFLLFLAFSGMFMIRGRKGLIGRGAIIVAIGIAVPILYVHWSGGP